MKINSKSLLVLAVGAILSLASCNNDGGQSSSQASSKEETTTSQQQSSEQKSSEQKSSEQQTSEQQTSEQVTSEQTTSEEQQTSEQTSSQEQQSPEQSTTSQQETTSEEPAPTLYAINVLENEFVDLSVDKAEAEEGELVKITVAPKNEKVVLDAVLVNGVPLNAVDGEYAFNMPAEAVTVAAQAHQKNDVTITQIDGVVLTADKEYADEGEIVNVTADYDAEKVDFECIKAGDIVLGENGDGSFYFVMPNHAVDLQAVATIGLVHSITCTSTAGSSMIDVNSAREGDIVNFTISVLNGYNFISASIEDVDLIDNLDGTFSFVMPGHPVEVQIELEAAEFKLDYNDSHIRSVTYNAGTDDDPEWLAPDGVNGNFFKYNSEIRVEIKDTDIDQVVGLLLGGANPVHVAREADSNFIYFNMPSHKVNLGVELQELLHQFVVNDEAASHFTFSFFRKNQAGEYVPTSGASIYEETYLKVEAAEGVNPDDYGIRSLSLTFTTYTYNDTSLETRKIDLLKTSTWSKGLNEDGYYGFILSVSTGEHMMTTGDDSKVILDAVEKDLTQYANKSWVGSYKGVEAYGTGNGTSFSSSYSPTIDGAGEFKLSGTNFYVLSDDADNKTLHVAQLGSETEKGIAVYSDKLMAAHYNIGESLFPNAGRGDLFIGVNIPTNANVEDYGIFYDSFTIDSAQYIVAEFTYQGAFYAAAYADVANGTINLDAQITMLTGENILADGATYTIAADGVTLGGFGYKDGQHLLLDGKQGVYNVAESEKTMSLNGVGGAVYDDKNWDYVVGQDGNVTLTKYEMTVYGKICTTVVASLEGDVATIISTNVGDPITYEVELKTNAVFGVNNVYGWTLTESGTYEPLNSGIHSTTAEMSITAIVEGTLAFDYKVSSENAVDDFFAIYKGNTQQGNKMGGETWVEGHFEVDLKAGESIHLIYRKDHGVTKGEDKAIVSNVAFETAAFDGFEGTYALDNESTAIVDGHGVASIGGKDYNYDVPEIGNEIVVEYDDYLIETDGATPVHVTITLNKDTKQGTVVTTPTGEKQSFVVDNETLDTGLQMYKGGHVQPNYHFTNNGDGSYTSSNAGVKSSTAEMTIVAYRAGTVSFHLSGGGESGWDTTRIYLNGQYVQDFTAANYGDNADVEIEVSASDRIQICYSKDSSGDTSPDSVTVSNIVFTPASSEPEALTLTVNLQIPDTWEINSFYDADAVVFAYVFGGDYETPTWLPTIQGEGGAVTFALEAGKVPEAFVIVRCAPGTVQGSFEEGVKWNQTGDITFVQGQIVYNVSDIQ